MATYKEQQQDKKYYVLLKNGVPLGTFGNLKKVVEFMEARIFPATGPWLEKMKTL